MKKAIILHSLPYHYEMIGSILHYFSDYQIDILSLEDNSWNKVYSTIFKNYKSIHTVINTNYNLCIIPTDDDMIMCDVYKKFFSSIPVYIINHIKIGNRSPIDNENKKCLNIHGIQKPLEPFHFCGYKYLKSTQDKLQLLSKKVSVAIIGDIINTERFFFKHLFNRFTNFYDIDFHVINRTESMWKINYPNIYYHINCNTEEMFKTLEKCHYVYFFAFQRGKKTSSASFALAYSTLCRMLCSDDKKHQYEISSPSFHPIDSKITLSEVSKADIEEVEKERELLLSKTSHFISEIITN